MWVLPKDQGCQVGDVVAFGETGHRLLSLVPRDDVAWDNVIDAALATHGPEEVRRWVTEIDLWLGMKLRGSWR